MIVKELIKALEKCPQDLPIRVVESPLSLFTPETPPNEDDSYSPNMWVYDTELYNTGESGYEVSGEIILLTSE